MTKKINVGIIGVGRIGSMHAKNLTFHIPQANIVAVSDVVLDAAKKCAEECNIPKATQNYEEILTDKNIDAVFICSSTNTHVELICAAAEHGKHIFCEKPIALDLELIEKALASVKKAGVKLQIGFHRRFDPSFSQARELVKAGKIGVPHSVRITSRDPEPPPYEYIKVSGGIFSDMTIHDFDMARYLLGEEIVEIYARGNALVDPEIGKLGDIDTAITIMQYEKGAFCTIENSRKAVYGHDQRVEVFGSEGAIMVGNRFPQAGELYTAHAVQHNPPYYFFLDRYPEAFLEETRQFFQALEKDQEPKPNGFDGKIAVVIALAAKKSYAEHRPILL